MTKTVKWVVFTNHEIEFGFAKLPETGQRHFVLVDSENKHRDELLSLGFEPSQRPVHGAGIYFSKPGYQLQIADLRKAFGADSVQIVQGDQSQFLTQFSEVFREKTRMNANAFFAQREIVGFNADKHAVYDTAFGRVISIPKENPQPGEGQFTLQAEHTETQNDNVKFLRATNREELDAVAHAFVSRIFWKEDVRMKRDSFERLFNKTNFGDFSEREYQEAVEAASVRLLSEKITEANASPLQAFDIAQRLYDGLPPLEARTSQSIYLQQYSTPSPMSVLAQAMLARPEELGSASILEPTIGNGSLVSILQQHAARVCATEIDENRIARLDSKIECIRSDATTADWRSLFGEKEGFDFVIANPPFGDLGRVHNIKMPANSLAEEMPVQRLDHMLLLSTLNARKDQGRAVFITGADDAIGDGKIKGRSRYVLNYLHDHYESVDVVDVAGELYKKQGAQFPLRLYVIGNRRETPLDLHKDPDLIPDKLPVMRSYEQLREFAEDVIRAQMKAPLALTADALDTEEGAEPVDDNRQENQFQIPYTSFSRSGEATTMIPANLSGVIYEALTHVRELRGDIDEYVSRELQIDLESLPERFTPEQVDALALIFDAHHQDRGMLLADKMGVGKGRVLAACAVHAKLNGRIPAFFTVKPNLFTDFLERDIKDIGFRHLFTAPLIINSDAKTVDPDGRPVVRPPKAAEFKTLAQNGELPTGCDMIMLTYSQINRSPASSAKSGYMIDVASRYPLSILLDESHNGAGASNTSENLQRIIEGNAQMSEDPQARALGSTVVYSSGTPIKGAANLRLYSKVLPHGVNPDELLNVIQRDPLSMQEALNHEIAASGSFISRELDNSAIEKQFVYSKSTDRNRAVADQLAEILRGMSVLSGDVSAEVAHMNDKFDEQVKNLPDELKNTNRMQANSLNFGSRLYQLNRQFVMALKADDVVTHCLDALADNRKPIITIQSTGESLLRDFISRAHEEFESDDPEQQKQQSKTFSDVTLDKPITYKDLLHKYNEKLTEIVIRTGYGQVERQQIDDPVFKAAQRELGDMIDRLPDDLPMTPIDYVRNKIERAGYRMGEISGRSYDVTYNDDGGITITGKSDKGDKSRVNRVCREFNNGEIDVVLLTQSGSTGLSIHASPAVGSDLRPRRMIKWEMQANIAEEMQMDGRHNRTGQVEVPEFLIPLTGLPADDRLAMMFNNKSRSLTASSEANRDSKNIIREVPDLLNVVGDRAAMDMLYETHGLATKLDIKLPEDPEEAREKSGLWFASKTSSRLSLLPVAEQEATYADWQSRFTSLIDQLNAEGKNPLEVKVHKWNAKVIDSFVLQGEESTPNSKSGRKSMFDEPVRVTTVEFHQEMKPLKADQVDNMILANWEGVVAQTGVDSAGRCSDIHQTLQAGYQDYLKRNLAKRFESVEAALADEEDNNVKNMARTLNYLNRNLPNLYPGAVFMDTDEEGRNIPKVVVRYNAPQTREGYARAAEYVIYAVEPGSHVLEMTSLSRLMANKIDLSGLDFRSSSYARKQFDDAPAGIVRREAKLLDGNIFEAMCINIREKVGSKVVYTDEEGRRQHGILVRNGFSISKLENMAERVKNTEVLQAYLESGRDGHMITNNTDGSRKLESTTVAMRFLGREYSDGPAVFQLVTPAAKANGGHIFLDPLLTSLPGKEDLCEFGLHFEKRGSQMVARVSADQAQPLMQYLIDQKGVNFFLVDKQMLEQARQQIRDNNAQQLATDRTTVEIG